MIKDILPSFETASGPQLSAAVEDCSQWIVRAVEAQRYWAFRSILQAPGFAVVEVIQILPSLR